MKKQYRELFIGIDPGQSGAIVVLDSVTTYPNEDEDLLLLSATEHDIARFLRRRVRDKDVSRVHVYIERVASRPGQGVASMFKFGKHYGFLRGVLVALAVSFEEITPAKWQAAMGCLGKKTTKTEKKNATKARAQQLFPKMKRITHATADALLLAAHCRKENS